jgi:hypothetical protein
MATRGKGSMMARGRKVVTLAGPPVHDRRAKELTHQDVAAEEVDDPFEEGAKILVLRNLRDDPLAAMWKANQIDHCQFTAGRRWQEAYEQAEIGGARAIDYSATKVDGGKIPQPTVSDAQAKALSDLTRARNELGPYSWSIVFDVLGCHMTITQCCDKRMMGSERERIAIGHRFRTALDEMAIIFKLST